MTTINLPSHLKAKAKYDVRVFALVQPETRSIAYQPANDIYAALSQLGVNDHLKIDHGIVIPAHNEGELGFSVAVDRRAILTNEGNVIQLWAVDKRLFAGNGIVYAHTLTQKSIDCPPAPIRFFDTMAAVQQEFAAKTLDVPKAWDGANVAWTWPAKAPEVIMARALGSN
jgi:hypothetical protein